MLGMTTIDLFVRDGWVEIIQGTSWVFVGRPTLLEGMTIIVGLNMTQDL